MNYLALTPEILLGIINTKLRDFYSNLIELCDDLDINKNDLIDKLSLIDYYYDESINQFIKKEE